MYLRGKQRQQYLTAPINLLVANVLTVDTLINPVTNNF
jgi:hypothetical protein